MDRQRMELLRAVFASPEQIVASIKAGHFSFEDLEALRASREGRKALTSKRLVAVEMALNSNVKPRTCRRRKLAQ
jgi:hypothetical protein